jgi:hypothetical protein
MLVAGYSSAHSPAPKPLSPLPPSLHPPSRFGRPSGSPPPQALPPQAPPCQRTSNQVPSRLPSDGLFCSSCALLGLICTLLSFVFNKIHLHCKKTALVVIGRDLVRVAMYRLSRRPLSSASFASLAASCVSFAPSCPLFSTKYIYIAKKRPYTLSDANSSSLRGALCPSKSQPLLQREPSPLAKPQVADQVK